MLLQCGVCSIAGCRDCDVIFECKNCHHVLCDGCGLILWHCMSCEKGSCEKCNDVIVCVMFAVTGHAPTVGRNHTGLLRIAAKLVATNIANIASSPALIPPSL
jgi:hypothetical protein